MSYRQMYRCGTDILDKDNEESAIIGSLLVNLENLKLLNNTMIAHTSDCTKPPRWVFERVSRHIEAIELELNICDETPKKDFVKGLSMLTGYICSECAGEDPEDWADRTKTMYPARKSHRYDNYNDLTDEEEE